MTGRKLREVQWPDFLLRFTRQKIDRNVYARIGQGRYGTQRCRAKDSRRRTWRKIDLQIPSLCLVSLMYLCDSLNKIHTQLYDSDPLGCAKLIV